MMRKLLLVQTLFIFRKFGVEYNKQISFIVKNFGMVLGEKTNPSDLLIGINCYDRALHRISETKKPNVTSYNTLAVLATSMAMRYRASNPSSVLTWKHIVGDENMSNVVPAVSYVYKWLVETLRIIFLKFWGGKIVCMRFTTKSYSCTDYTFNSESVIPSFSVVHLSKR